MSEENVEVVRQFFQDWLTLDPSADATWHEAAEVLDPEFEYREDPGWPGAGEYRGIPAFHEVVRGNFEAFGEMRLEAEEVLEAGDRVVVLIYWWARGPSGVEAEMRQAGIFTVRAGRVASWQVVFHRDEALEAVGLRK